MPTVNWFYSPADEDRITRVFGATFTRDTVALDAINWDASFHNNNRGFDDQSSHVDENHMTSIGVSMLDGRPIPAVIVRQNGRGLYIIDGNHRATAARELGANELDVLYVECPDDTADNMARFANLGQHGKGQDQSVTYHTINNAVADGMALDVACSLAGVKRSTFDAWATRDRAKRKVARVGVDMTPSAKVAAAINRVDDEQLEVLAPELPKAKPGLLEEVSKRIAEAPPSQRTEVAHEAKGELRAARASGAKNKNKAGAITKTKGAITQLKSSLRQAMESATPEQRQAIYDDVHSLYLTARQVAGE